MAIYFIYLGFKEIYCFFLRHTALALFYFTRNAVYYFFWGGGCSINIFFINCVLKFQYQLGCFKAEGLSYL